MSITQSCTVEDWAESNTFCGGYHMLILSTDIETIEFVNAAFVGTMDQ